MPIFIILIIVLIICSVYARARIANLLRGAGYYIVGTWHNIHPIIHDALVTALTVGGICWAVMIILMALLGFYANSSGWAFFISIAFPFWFVAFIMPPALNRVWLIGRSFQVLKIFRILLTPLLVIAVIFLSIGLWSPEVKKSIDRGTRNMKSGIANSLNESSSHSETESGIFRRIGVKVITTKFRTDDSEPFAIEASAVVKIVDWNGIKATGVREGFSRVVSKNVFGNYDGAKVGWVPTRAISEGDLSPGAQNVSDSGMTELYIREHSAEMTWLEPGKYLIIPRDTLVRLKNETSYKNNGGTLTLSKREIVYFFLNGKAGRVTLEKVS